MKMTLGDVFPVADCKSDAIIDESNNTMGEKRYRVRNIRSNLECLKGLCEFSIIDNELVYLFCKSLIREVRSVILSVMFGLIIFCPVNAQGQNSGVHPQSWMAELPDSRGISTLSIPGTHNSGALHEPLMGTAACQSLTIKEQLESGVRFFDIRCRHEDDRFSIYHGPVFQQLKFDQVQLWMCEFLRDHPQEVLIVSVKQESSPRNNTRRFEETFQEYLARAKGLYYSGEGIPRLEGARGQIILLKRFSAHDMIGIDATKWGHSGFFQGRQLYIQDRFKVADIKGKWGLVEKAFEHCIHKENQGLLHLNYTSGYVQNALGIPNIVKVSAPINQRLAAYLENRQESQLGCVVMDFITPKLSTAIYSLNFAKDK